MLTRIKRDWSSAEAKKTMQQQQLQRSLTNNNNNSTPHPPQLSSLFPLPHHFDPSAAADDDFFLDHMLSTLTSPSPSWPTADHDFTLPDPSSKLRLHQIASDQFVPHLNGMGGGYIEALYNGFGNGGSGSLQGIMGSGQAPVTFIHQSSQSLGSEARESNDGGTAAQSRQRVRARRGQATDPHSIAERLRRERIAERMKSLQELVPNANKTDKASMLDEIIDYVKFLQLQAKVLSMSRLGGAASVAPLVVDMSSEGGPVDGGQHKGSDGNAGDGSLALTEHQVAKLMEEDMGSAMQYLQGKGLCLMPISLATAISTVTCQSRAAKPQPLPPLLFGANGNGPSSPGLSTLTVQSATTIIGNTAATNGSIGLRDQVGN